MPQQFALSIVICTYDRYPLLNDTVQSVLASASFDPAQCELLVVDNTPTHKRQPITADDRVKVVTCDEVGLSAARNMGITESKADVIVFLDDDALVSDQWCQRITDAFANDAVVAMGGRVVPKFSVEQLPPWFGRKLAEYLSCIDWGDGARFLRRGEWIVGANMAVRREVFARIGLFNTSLGRKGAASLLSNEEIALLEAIGLESVYYDPEAWIYHVIPNDRLELTWFRKRAYWQAISDFLAGSSHITAAAAERRFREIVVSTEAQHRGIDMFAFPPTTYEQFLLQLEAIYLNAIMMCSGISYGQRNSPNA